jgi:hypothetical protein
LLNATNTICFGIQNNSISMLHTVGSSDRDPSDIVEYQQFWRGPELTSTHSMCHWCQNTFQLFFGFFRGIAALERGVMCRSNIHAKCFRFNSGNCSGIVFCHPFQHFLTSWHGSAKNREFRPLQNLVHVHQAQGHTPETYWQHLMSTRPSFQPRC